MSWAHLRAGARRWSARRTLDGLGRGWSRGWSSSRPCWRLLLEIGVEERKDFVPAVHRLLLPVCATVVVEEAVAGAVITVELVFLALFLQLFLVLVDVSRRRALIVIAE